MYESEDKKDPVVEDWDAVSFAIPKVGHVETAASFDRFIRQRANARSCADLELLSL